MLQYNFELVSVFSFNHRCRHTVHFRDVQTSSEYFRLLHGFVVLQEVTVKGLEPDIQKLIAKHKAEVKKLKSTHQVTLCLDQFCLLSLMLIFAKNIGGFRFPSILLWEERCEYL